ncbi:MAG: hypothetical protein K6G00_02235 [Treponema sp.]|nr:hypothetical protein [Treponema sp.]
MLKKVFKMKLLQLLLVLMAFAGVCEARPWFEFTVDYSCLTECSSSINFNNSGLFNQHYDGTLKKKVTSPAGIGGSATIFFGAPFKSLELGIGTSVSYNTFSRCLLDGEEEKTDNGYVLSFAGGPAARFSFGKHTSLYFSPGVRFTIQNIKTKISAGDMSYKEKNIMLNLSAGIREWLFSSDRTNVGLDAGFDFAYPLNSFSQIDLSNDSGLDYSETYKVSSGRFLKFYVGLCLNFGNRNTK